MNVEQEHFNSKMREMMDEVHDMAHRYDAKMLAIVLLSQSANLFQACLAVQLMSEDEIRRTIAEATKNVYDPIPADQMPKVGVIGKPMRLS
jgi:hypothetical protein